ncbi:hypothetical protein BC940DRAFT_245973, partial [Gongronella butleri]
VRRHMKNPCHLRYRRVTLIFFHRDKDDTITKRFKTVSNWVGIGVNWMNECVFFGRSSF